MFLALSDPHFLSLFPGTVWEIGQAKDYFQQAAHLFYLVVEYNVRYLVPVVTTAI